MLDQVEVTGALDHIVDRVEGMWFVTAMPAQELVLAAAEPCIFFVALNPTVVHVAHAFCME